MKIKSIETFSRKEACIVRVRTDEGFEGYGQTATYNADITALVLHRQIAHNVLGKDAFDIGNLADNCIEMQHKFPGSYICRAAAGVDTALWDLKGKIYGKSVCELLGGKPGEIDVYGSSMRRDITPEEEALRLQKLHEEKGFRACKIRVGKELGHDCDQWPGRTEKLIKTVSKMIKGDALLYADANSCYTPEKAVEVGKMLEEYGFCHFEEPCPYWEIEWSAKVAEELRIPVAGGEQDNSLAQFKRIIKTRAVDIIQPDICYIGGLSRALQVAKMAGEEGMLCVPHSANLSLVAVFTLHFCGAIKNAGPFMEFSIEPSNWVQDLYYPLPEVIDGRVKIPEGPGWGISINRNWLENSDYQISQI